MRTPATACLALLFATLLPACIFVVHDDSCPSCDGSWWNEESWSWNAEPRASEARELASFERVEAGGSIDVRVELGAPQSVTVEGHPDRIGEVATDVEAGTLRIGWRDGAPRESRGGARVRIRVPALGALALNGSGDADLERASGAALSLTLAGSGDLQASGAVDQLTVTLSGSGDAELARLVARHAHVTLSGSGDAHVTATEELDANLSGSGDLSYGGRPKEVRQRVSGSGAVESN
jgi:hypothetical protein